MKILLVDADSTIPNMALMKLSSYHKLLGDSVELIRLNMKYFPHINKKRIRVPSEKYDKTYCSIIFNNNRGLVLGDNIEFGGTGHDIEKKLSQEVDVMKPDYSIYPENKIVYGFLTRGCIRNCYFCFVPKKEGKIRLDRTLEQILDVDFEYDSVEFMDNNILGIRGRGKILDELIEWGGKMSFNQGLDIRLVNDSVSAQLSRLNYNGAYKFAFDDWRDKNLIEKKLAIMEWRKPYQFRFYMYFNPNTMDLENLNNRIRWAKENKVLPYVMRDISCWDKPEYFNYLSDIIQWANVPSYFVQQNIYDCISRYRNNVKRAKISADIFNTNILVDSRDSEQISLFG